MERELELKITGMSCADCARHVEPALQAAGARRVSVDWRRGTATAAGPLDRGVLEQQLAGTRYAVGESRSASDSRFATAPARTTTTLS